MELRLSTGYKAIMKLALPISLAILVPQINFITNNIFLAGLGQTELAVAGITGVYYLMFAVIGNGLNNGLQALIARRAGQNLPHEIGRIFFHGIWLALAISAIGIVFTHTLAPSILRATLHDDRIAEMAIDFLHIRIWGLPLLYLYVMRNALLVGTNQTRLLIWGALAEAITNIVLDYGLIYGKLGMPQLGFNGAAYASIIAEGTGLLVIYAVIHMIGMHKRFSLFKDIRWEGALAKHILVKSSPLIAQFSISIATWEYFYILIEHQGERALAISNTMRNIFGLFGIFSWAFASTTNTMVSNIIGQGREDEVLRLVMRIVRSSFAISLFLFALLNFWPEWFLSFYGQDEAFIRDAIPVVRVVSIALLMMSFGTVWLNAVTGTGNTTVNLWIEMITLVIYVVYVYVVLEYYNMPITWGWASEWVYWTSMFVMAVSYMRSGKWRGKSM
ncbi:MAG TPA: MATE family efflux transporter [Chryseosolibacter sp.]|nr:MATE family efflux transporter [Chryseosolibacter sp.]